MKQFLMTLAERGVRLTVQDGKLFVAAGLQHLTDADKLQLQQQRQEIIRFIGARDPHNSRPEIRPAAAGTQVLSFAQQRLWFIDQLQGGSAEYNIPLAFCLHGQPDLNAITAAFNQILQRHQILRTVYRTVQGMPQTEVLNRAQLVLHIVDRRKAQAALPVSAWLAQEAGRPFDLANDLMLRVSYLQLADADRADYGDADGILLLNLHHIAADGWSMDVLFREFVQAYQLVSGAEVAPLPPLQIQYADYASWQREWAQGARHQAQLQYWQQQLADAPVLHQLPLQQPRPATKQTAGALVSATLGADCAQALLALARRYQLTPFMLLHAALALVLSRYSASHDIVLGSPLANRPDPQLEPLIGFFVNTLVFRLDTRKPDLASYLAHVRQVHLDAQQHQDVPFEQLVDLLQIPRAANHSPLFQSLLTTSNEFQPLRQPVAAQLGNVQIRPLDDSELTIKFDLDIHLTLSDDAVSSGWIYDQSLFSHDQISRMNQHLLNVLQSLAALAEAEPAQFVGLDQIRMLSHAELQQLQLQPRQQMPLPVAGIHQLFEKQVQQQPAQIALIDGAQQLSYQALDQQAEAVAAYLLDVCQLQPGQPVGIYMTRSAAQIATVLGILKAGGAYVPLDLTAQPQRLAYIVADVALTLLCHDASALPEGLAGLQQVPIADVLAAAAPHAGRAPQPVQATDLAYILYTSGSTGTPKGVCQTHGTLVNLVEHQAQADGVTAALPTLQFTPLTFDVSVQELATCWRTGSPLVLCSQQQKDQLDQLADLLAQQQIGRLFLPPAVFELLTEQLQATGATLPALREVFVAGDVCRMTPDLRSFMQQHPQCRVFNHYGPTETHVVSSYQLHSSDEGDCSIGMAVANTALLVLDPALSPVPLGCIGELYVAGPGVARGYANSEQRSADSFIANPYAGAVPALARMYKTGDLVVQQADGRLSFIGRADQQLKIRGFRIEPAEIELQLQQYPGIDSALVLAVPGPAGQKQLVAYLRRTPDADATAEAEQALTGALKNYLGSVLPPYMVPAQLLFVSQWPLTVNGKINRAALPPVRLLSATQQLIAPACPLQSALRDIWAGLLQVPAEQLCVQANFFDCGGHSLLAVRLVAAVRAQLAAELTVRDIFTAGTIAAQALLCQQRAGQPVRPALTAQRQ